MKKFILGFLSGAVFTAILAAYGEKLNKQNMCQSADNQPETQTEPIEVHVEIVDDSPTPVEVVVESETSDVPATNENSAP